MQTQKAIQVEQHLDLNEIEHHLKGVEYSILAQPSVRDDSPASIHFTIFLNTQEPLPDEVKDAVFEKFCSQYGIRNVIDLIAGIDTVAFAKTGHDTPMPMHLYKKEHQKIANIPMYIFDFEADADQFNEVRNKGLTGWSYSYA
ncbi:MAG: hypothetical protein DSZ03_00430 [Sulfurimonas sp.]|nr:MAG: hypothetical protein DSZ03_00430 [Sulfurimonas sp.]